MVMKTTMTPPVTKMGKSPARSMAAMARSFLEGREGREGPLKPRSQSPSFLPSLSVNLTSPSQRADRVVLSVVVVVVVGLLTVIWGEQLKNRTINSLAIERPCFMVETTTTKVRAANNY